MTIRKFAPLDPEHPLVSDPRSCPLCGSGFTAGDEICLLPNPTPQEVAERATVIEGAPTHWACFETRRQTLLT